MASLYESAFELLLRNLKRGPVLPKEGAVRRAQNLSEYCYVCPSHAIYPHQWLWDSCFHAIVMARFRPDLAKAELRTLCSMVEANGFLPHLISWRRTNRVPGLDGIALWLREVTHVGHLTQPPVLAIAVEEVYHQCGDKEFVVEVLPAVKRHYRYFATQRDPDGDGLVSIVFPIESGMDHLPVYDTVLGIGKATALRYHLANLTLATRYLAMGWSLDRIFSADLFSVEDVGFNAIYVHGLRALARLATLCEDPDDVRFTRMAERVERALIERCYDQKDRAFYSLYSKSDRPIKVLTVASLLPLLLDSLPRSLADELVGDRLLNPSMFWTPYPVPSVSVGEPTFRASSDPVPAVFSIPGWLRRQLDRHHLIWRGPSWINTNWMLGRGLRRHGYNQVADELTRRTAAMVANSGFWEYYDPLSGVGLGAGDFGWSTLVVDMLANAADPSLVEEYAAAVAATTLKAESYPGTVVTSI